MEKPDEKYFKEIFHGLYNAKTEEDVDIFIGRHPEVFKDENWFPLGGDEKMFGIVRNQQSSPIAALVEKVTNSIDAILMKKCFELGGDPQSPHAPRTMEEAIQKFFPEHKNWDLQTWRRKQAEEIQVVADGPTRQSAVIIYDNGEGQHPEDFENTFLSLVRGNKINIHFVQGKYNMGGSGALVFCGKKRYHLIGSKRYDGKGNFGFTLIRQRKIGEAGGATRFSYFEYFKIAGKIPSFSIDELDLRLYGRNFKTGTIIKMYMYQFPSGYAGFAQDLNQSLNEFLFEPVLPILTVDKKERYPLNKVLELDLYGLKRRLEEERNDYVQSYFSEEYDDELFGKAKVTCYVFKPKLDDRDVKRSKEIIRERFFRNNMAVMFSVNGQVHGSYTSEFITRTLKFNLLKDYLLIHVDCTGMKPDFREELFMASRDRLKQGDESGLLRDYLGKTLRKSQLDEINRLRKESIGIDSEDTSELIRSFAKNLPKDSELYKLLQNTLKLEEKKDKQKQEEGKQAKDKQDEKPFQPKRFPSQFKLHKKKDGVNVVTVPINGERTIKFDTDVEDNYFDRIEESGEMQLALLQVKRNTKDGGDRPGKDKEVSGLLNIIKSSPTKGTIKMTLNPKSDLAVGDEIEIKVSLTAAGEPLEEIIHVLIGDPEKPKEPTPKEEKALENIGLPELKKVWEKDWKSLEEQGIQMDHETVMYPVGEGDKLDAVYINMDSHVFLNHRKKLKNEEQITVAQKKYLTSVYFHTIFLYMITKRRNYSLTVQKDGSQQEITIDEYIRDVFDSYYSDFLLNFGMEQLMAVLEE
ncbi:MAG: hypothetical protein A2161_08245 [Candidatus Schekmanbacteria bacterium RBG_13_48_7]|uniref:Uncharacterized protein n=1 Tax=Candidatus Schekmanbacteria bacterium RBG_13_48_7 TaxID=1817878 RepID=A0A1F7RQ22_9BACT|nr:MAG: hypothetical protein A2161_08245 [Candidatus Schekmanbacteria bacterium RBG_13_48_7]